MSIFPLNPPVLLLAPWNGTCDAEQRGQAKHSHTHTPGITDGSRLPQCATSRVFQYLYFMFATLKQQIIWLTENANLLVAAVLVVVVLPAVVGLLVAALVSKLTQCLEAVSASNL